MACFVLREWPLQLSRKSRHKGGEGRGGGGSTQDEKKREREDRKGWPLTPHNLISRPALSSNQNIRGIG